MIDNKYTPHIQLLIFKLKIVNVMCSFQSCDINVPLDNSVFIGDLETYKKYVNIDNKFYNQIIDKENMSEYHNDVITTELEYLIRPLRLFWKSI